MSQPDLPRRLTGGEPRGATFLWVAFLCCEPVQPCLGLLGLADCRRINRAACSKKLLVECKVRHGELLAGAIDLVCQIAKVVDHRRYRSAEAADRKSVV